MILSKKKVVAMALSFILFGALCFGIGVAYSNGGNPTIDPSPGQGVFNFDWLNATIGVSAPEFWHEDLGNYSAWVESQGGGVIDHGALTGLSDNDHDQYLFQDGSEELTGDWDAGSYGVNASWIDVEEFYKVGVGNYSAWVMSLNGTEVADHGVLTGLGDDDHEQYLLDSLHTKANHDSLGLDHGSLDGLADDDHSQYFESADHTLSTHTGLGLQVQEYTTTGLADHSYSGTAITGTAGEALAIGDLTFLDSDGKYWMTDANLSSKMFCVAICLETISTDSTGLLLIEGYLRDDSWTGWTVGSESPLLVSWTLGEMTQTLPTETGDQVQVIGYSIASKIIRFDPDSTTIEVV